MQVILVGDIHLSGQKPLARTDDVVSVQFEKVDEVVSIANQYGCSIISVGDIFNTSIISNSLLSQLGDILNRLKNPLYFVCGNHDLLYHSMDMFERTSLGMLYYNNQKIKHVSELEFDSGDWNMPIDNKHSDVLVIHQAIIKPDMVGGNSSWILKDTEFARDITTDKELQKYKLIICGHWHKQYTFKYKNTLVINPGPLVRRSVNEIDEPTIQLLDLNTLKSKIIKLKSVKPTEDVLTDKHIEEKSIKTKTDISNFVQALQTKTMTTSFLANLMELIESGQLDKDIEKLLREYIAKYLEKKGGK